MISQGFYEHSDRVSLKQKWNALWKLDWDNKTAISTVCLDSVFHLGRIHLVLNKTLTDDTSIKQAQIKTFFV